MSLTHTEHVIIDALKQRLGIAPAMNAHDDILRHIVISANREVDAQLTVWLGPPPWGDEAISPIRGQAAEAAVRYAEGLWYERQSQIERAKYSMEIYEKRIEALRESVKATRPNRARTRVVTIDDPRDSSIFSPLQIARYTTRIFY